MKFYKTLLVLVGLISTLMTSCIKDDAVILEGAFVEWDAATYNANAVGQTFPFLTRVPRYGEAQNNADPALTRTAGTVKFRVNLVGAHRSTPTEVTYRVVADKTTAVAGTHFVAPAGKVTIPANSSYGEVSIDILNAAPSAGTKDLVLELVGGGDVKPSENEKFLGIRIAQN